jgi:hypothetical protein
MFRARILLAAVLAVSALAVLAIPASASVPAANTKFCKAAAKIGDTSGSPDFSPTRAKQIRSQFKAAAKYAPGKVKSAINTISGLLGTIAGTSNPADLAKVYTSSSFRKYPAAISTYVKYQAAQCSGL